MALRFVLALVIVLCAGLPAWSAPPPCAKALRNGGVCRAASEEARRLFNDRQVSGAVVVESVATGDVLIEASSLVDGHAGEGPPLISTISSILPLSTSKLFLAASTWTHADGIKDRQALDRRVHQMLLHSLDDEGRKLAVEERALVGSPAILADLALYGLPACGPREQDTMEFDRTFGSRFSEPISVRVACTTLNEDSDDRSWGSAFSLGEDKFSLSPFHLARFIQAIGNDGVALAPIFRNTAGPLAERPATEQVRVMMPTVARLLQQALLDTVADGTAKGVQGRLRGGWQIGGKTGTTALYGEPYDGIFAGLVFDPKGGARYAFVVYVRRGGKGGGAAAEIACDLFNYALGL